MPTSLSKFDRAPLPANVEMERCILGSILLDSTIYEQTESLTTDDFSLDSHRRIFSTIAAMAQDGEPIETLTLKAKLEKSKQLAAIGGLAYLSELTEGVPRRTSIAHCVKLVRDAALRRRLMRLADEIGERATAESMAPDAIAENAAAELTQLARSVAKRFVIPDPLELPEAPTLWTVGGMIPAGGVSILAGEPKSGKSWLALSIAKAVSSGNTFLDRECEQRDVYILDREQPLALVQERARVRLGGPTPRIHWWGCWCEQQPPTIGDPRLLAIGRELKPLFIFDSFTRFHTAKDENSASEMTPVMNALRALANTGASVLVLHHRGKGENAPRYRGTSEILAGADAGLSLIKGEDGLLCLDGVVRGAPEWKLWVRPDLSCGQFELVDSPAFSDRKEKESQIAAIIRKSAGISVTRITREAGMSKHTVLDILAKGLGFRWKEEKGEHGARCFYPIEEVNQ